MKEIISYIVDEEQQMTVNKLENILTKLGLLNRLKEARHIVIKPNFAAGTYASTESHIVTDIVFLKQFVNCLLKLNQSGIIYIAESDSTGYGFAYLKFKNLGISNFCEDERVKLLDLSRDQLVHVSVKNAKYFKETDRQLWLSSTLINADFIISMSNLKTHSITGYTGACKNLFGMLPIMNKEIYHPFIHKVVHDLVRAIKVDLSIVDGFFSMEQNGPVSGIPNDLEFRVYSSNPVIADIVSCKLSGIKWKKVTYLKMLHSADIKIPNLLPVTYLRPPVKTLRIFNRIGLLIQALGQALASYGHKIHVSRTFLEFLIISFRPMLIKIFGIERLKRWKKKLMKR